MARTPRGAARSSDPFLSTALPRRQPTSILPFVLSACEGTIIFYYSHLRFIIEVFLLFMSIKNGRRWYTQMNFLFLEWKLMLVSFEKDETKVFVLLKNELKFFHHNALFTTTKLFFVLVNSKTLWIQESFTSELAPQGPEFWVTVRQIMRSFLIVPDRCLFFSSCAPGLGKWTLARMDRNIISKMLPQWCNFSESLNFHAQQGFAAVWFHTNDLPGLIFRKRRLCRHTWLPWW